MRLSPLHGAPALFHTTGHWGESPSHHSGLHISHQEFPPECTLITYLWSRDTRCEDLEMCCPDLPSRTLPLVAASASSGQSSAFRASGGQPVCNDPFRWRNKGLASGPVRTTLKGHLHSTALVGSAKVIWPMVQLGFFPLLAPVSSLLIPRVPIPMAPLRNIPTLNSIWVHIPKNQPVTYIENIPEFGKDFYLKISGYTHNILK